MRHLIFDNADKYPVALLIKSSAFNKQEILTNYVAALGRRGITQDQLIGLSLEYNDAGKAPTKFIKEYLEELLPAIAAVGVQYLYCADANYFKILTGSTKAEQHLGYVLPCAVKEYEHLKIILGVNHRSLMYDPRNESKLELSLDTLANEVGGIAQTLGTDVIRHAEYPQSVPEIQQTLERLHQYPDLSCDIETGSLRFEKAGVATITFCWNEHEGVAFAVDYRELAEPVWDNAMHLTGVFGELVPNLEVRTLLKRFFETYEGTLKWHNSPYDTKVLIYNLWMKDLLDTAGLLTGLHTLHNRIHDTKIVAYLATNSAAGNKLGLKELAHEFAGNYAQEEIKDVRRIPLPKLLEYNLVDGLCTNWVFNKYYPTLVADKQEDLYAGLMMTSQKVITQVELTGMPLDADQVQYARGVLEHDAKTHLAVILKLPTINQLVDELTYAAWDKDYQTRKAKAKNPDKILPKDRAKFPRVVFNPGSSLQMQKLLYSHMGLPVIDYTKTKQPAVGVKTLTKLVNHTSDPAYIATLKAVQAYSAASKILSTFIPAFERAIEKGTDVVWLHGSFNLGGTKSGRLSSSDPNLQNIPATSAYGELIKSCFKGPKGWVFAGADFNSLEDYISALTTKDPNKLKVYTDGYDGHCLRAFSYFPERLPGIIDTVESINSIAKKFADIRQLSKTPTFALTYQGTFITLMNNLGFDEATAKQIEANYHELYKVSDEWVQDRLNEAAQTGYVTLAFGLRLRTPLLKQSLMHNRRTPYEAQAEGRTAGNALGQSYGLLNNRACNEFMQKVWASKYRCDVLPIAMIHDAIYLLIRDDVEVVEWVNRELIKSMEWQELPEIQHDTVKIGAALDLFYPTWADKITLPNNASQEEIRAKCMEFLAGLAEQQKEAA